MPQLATFPSFELPPQLRERPFDLIAVGNAMLEMVLRLAEWPGAGGQQDQAIPPPIYSAGGCATNVACFTGRLGGRVALVARLGQGRYGQPIWQELDRCGVDTRFIRRRPDKEGNLVIIMTKPDGDWSVLSYMDPDLELRPADLPPPALFQQAKFLYIDGFSYFQPHQQQAVAQAIEMARQHGCLVASDASVPLAQSRPAELAGLFARSDLVFANEFEGLAATQAGDLAEAMAKFQRLGPQLCFLKRGAAGSSVITRQAAGHIPAVPVKVVDTVAAGDAYLAATLLHLGRGGSLYESARRASAAAALACTGAGSLTAHFNAADVERMIA